MRLIHNHTNNNIDHQTWYIYNHSCKKTYANTIQEKGTSKSNAHTKLAGKLSKASYHKYVAANKGINANHTKYIQVFSWNQMLTWWFTFNIIGTNNAKIQKAIIYLTKITTSGFTKLRYFLYITLHKADAIAPQATYTTQLSTENHKANHCVVIHRIPKNIINVPKNHFHVNASFNHINHNIQTNIEDILAVTIAFIANVSLNHFINNNGDTTLEKIVTHTRAIMVFLSNFHMYFNSGIKPKKSKIEIIVNICDTNINVSGIVNWSKYLLKIL